MKMTLIQDSKRFWPILMANAVYYLFTGMSESRISLEIRNRKNDKKSKPVKIISIFSFYCH